MRLHAPASTPLYHIYLGANHPADLFTTPDDYRDFLAAYAHYGEGVLETYAYCLLPNHFHLFVGLTASTAPDGILALLFNAFATAAGRPDRLPRTPLLAVPVRDPANCTPLVRYIHQNPTLHGYAANFRLWNWSSYRAILSDRPSRVAVDTVLTWFHGPAWFEDMHWTVQDETQIGYLIRED